MDYAVNEVKVKLQPKHHMKCSHDLWECTEKKDAGAFSASAPRAPYTKQKSRSPRERDFTIILTD